MYDILIMSETKALRVVGNEKEWRKVVLRRDGFKCVLCGAKDGDYVNGKMVRLHVDHIKPQRSFPDLRFDVSNGRVLCEECHKKTPTFGRSPVRETPQVRFNMIMTAVS